MIFKTFAVRCFARGIEFFEGKYFITKNGSTFMGEDFYNICRMSGCLISKSGFIGQFYFLLLVFYEY